MKIDTYTHGCGTGWVPPPVVGCFASVCLCGLFLCVFGCFRSLCGPFAVLCSCFPSVAVTVIVSLCLCSFLSVGGCFASCHGQVVSLW